MSTSPNPSAIRSYVLRQGRMSNGQKSAYASFGEKYLIPFSESALDGPAQFGRDAPLVLEIGCGMGETTTEIALKQPGWNFLGIEVHAPGIGSLLNQIDANALTNLRLIQHDAVEVVRHMLSPGTLHGVHVFFPDPWPKKRHHKRRLLQPAFVHMLASRIEPGGYLHCATDWQDYALQMLSVLTAESALRNTAPEFAPRPEHRPETKFERRGIRLGHGVWDLVFLKS